MGERRMNWLERYRSYQEFLTLQTFNTLEQAEGFEGRFLLHRSQGSYVVCTGYIGQSRGAPPAWTHNEDIGFAQCDVWRAQRQAALTVGMELIGGKE